MNRARYIIGIDPDVDKSGLVVIDKKMRRVTHAEALDFPGVLVYLTLLKQEHAQEPMTVLVVIEDSDFSVNWHYNSHDSKGVCAAKGRSVGMCHATARHLRECCESIGLPVMMQQPLRKFWKGKDGKITHEEAAPRTWTQQDIDRTAASIEEDPDFLEDRPLLVVPLDEVTFLTFAGNLRHEGCITNGRETAPCVIYYPETEEDRQTVIRRAMKDNGSFGQWDTELLKSDWSGMPLGDWGVKWDEGETQDAGHNVNFTAHNKAKEDEFDEGKDEIHVLCRPGDIWQLGEHRLMCGDSVDLQQVKTLLGGVKCDMLFTDPPYGVAIGDKNAQLNSVQKAGRCTTNIKNDTLSVPDLYEVLKAAMANVRESMKDDACYYVCAPPGGDFGLMMMMMMRDAGLPVRHQIVWNKNSATFSLGRLDYDYKHEAIMYTWGKNHHNYRKGQFRTSVWDIDKPRKCDLHPTMKPVELVANCMLDGSQEGDSVLDVFGGSGTTLIVSEQLGRKCYMMELDPHYCDVIIARWEKFTGKKAELLNGEQTS